MVSVPEGLTLLTALGQKSFAGGGEQYALEEVLGEGSYGSVYRCLRASDSAVLAVKIIDTMRVGFVGGLNGIKAVEIMASREVDALRQLSSHPNVVSLSGAFYAENTRQIFIVTDFVPGSHLFSHVVQRIEPLKEPETSHIVAQLSDAMSFCHALGVVHRDLKLENVLVASIDVRLEEHVDPSNKAVTWRTNEIFSVKICDFGFAKSLQGYTTRTPLGTGTYAAPEVGADRTDKKPARQCSPELNIPGLDGSRHVTEAGYDAFKADAFSLGVMVFVMLCLSFPSKDYAKGSHRTHKLWPALSLDVKSLIDGLLEVNPSERLSIVAVCSHAWVKRADCDENDGELRRYNSKERILREADSEWKTRRSPQPKWRQEPDREDVALPGVLALHRALVHIQQERGMACWALSGSPGMGGISCWEQLQWHVQLTEKRIHEAKALMDKSKCALKRQVEPVSRLSDLCSVLTNARKLAIKAAAQPGPPADMVGFDNVFMVYNQACGALIEIVATSLESVRPGSAEGRRAARRYRLFSTAAEQLGRERAFMFGKAAASNLGLLRIAEIIGARKILLGTVGRSSAEGNGDIVANSAGLLGALVGEGDESLLSPNDIMALETIEHGVLNPGISGHVDTDEWYQTITRLLNEIHSRIAIGLVEDMRMSAMSTSGFDLEDIHGAPTCNKNEGRTLRCSPQGSTCGCRSGLKRVLQSLADQL